MIEYRYQYNTLYSPSAPFVDIIISATPHKRYTLEAKAQVDSGSDASALPTSILVQINAGKQRVQRKEPVIVRDLLNHFSIMLDGPALTTIIPKL